MEQPQEQTQDAGFQDESGLRTYEDIRDKSPVLSPVLRSAWQEADRQERQMREAMDRVIADEDLTDEAKKRRVDEIQERRGAEIAAKRGELRESLLKAASSADRASVPVPTGQSLIVNDTNSLLLDELQTQRLVRTIERRQDKPGPFRYSPLEHLQSEYRRALKELEGTEAGSLARAVLRAADELGIDRGSILSAAGIRQERHLVQVDRARRLTYFSDMISTKPPKLNQRVQDRLDKAVRRGGDVGRRSPRPLILGGEQISAPGESPPRDAEAPESKPKPGRRKQQRDKRVKERVKQMKQQQEKK
jgi:hypothetical protein